MTRVLHVLPHPGGGAETYVDLLERLPGYAHERVWLSTTRSRRRGIASVLSRWPAIALRARRADLVHVHGDMAAMIASPLVRGRPLLISTHGLHRLRRSHGAPGALLGRRFRGAVAASVRTVCTSAAEREELAAALPGALANRLIVVPNGVAVPSAADPTERGRAREALGLGDGEVAALFVGQLEERKDPMAAIAATAAVRRAGIPLVLMLAGDGPLGPAVAAEAGDAIRPLGFRHDVPSLYAAADLFLLTSRREGMSMALLEAMSQGLPVLAVDGPGIAETVGEAGVIVPAGQPAALADGLRRLAGDDAARATLGGAARRRVLDHFSVERFLAGLGQVYASALSEVD